MSESLTVESRKTQWEEKTLGELCDFVNGYAFKSKDFRDSGVPVIRISNIKNNRISKNKLVFVGNENLESLRAFTSSKGDILIAMSGATTGKIGINDLDECSLLNQRVGKFIPKVGLSKNYLYYFLNIFSSHFLNISEGSAQPNLSTKQIKETLINIPSLEEQKRIVDVLDKAFETIDKAIANTEANLASTKELFQSVLNDAFENKGDDWEEKTLGEVCELLNGYAFKSLDKVDSSEVQLLRMGNLYKNELDISRKPVFYPRSFYDKFEKYRVLEGDLVISLTGTVGKKDYGYAVRISKIKKLLLLNQRISKFINISEHINKDFLLFLMRSPSFLEILYSISNGTRQANISPKDMLKIKIHIPPLASQIALVNLFKDLSSKTKQLEALYESKLASLKELKQSLLQKAFSGAL